MEVITTEAKRRINSSFKSYSNGISRATLGFIFVIAIAAQPVMAQEINGIYTEAATKDLGDVTGKKSLKGIKFRGWFEAYIERNFNDPSASVVNANQGLSVLKARDLKIEGRTFDLRSDSFRFW